MAVKIGEMLLKAGYISQEQLNEAKQVSKDQNIPLSEALIRLNYASGEEVMRAVAQEHGREYVDLNEVQIPPGVIDHKEWTPDNGRNNALRINGLGAPRAFFTPVLRKLNVPSVSYG